MTLIPVNKNLRAYAEIFKCGWFTVNRSATDFGYWRQTINRITGNIK